MLTLKQLNISRDVASVKVVTVATKGEIDLDIGLILSIKCKLDNV